MIITWLGHSCFKIQDKPGSDGATVITDPFDQSTGLKVPRCEANIVTVSHDHHDHNNIASIKGSPVVISGAGEYEVSNVFIEGAEAYHDEKQGAERGKNIMYRIDIDDMSVAHLGDLGHILDAKQLEQFEGTDILLIPVGGNFTIGAKKAVEVVSQIEPRIVIPMHYKVPGLKIDLDGVEKFIKELGLKPTYEDKLKISKKDLPQEDMELVVLKI
ncbi:MBL fold metallo-hydrolase [Patescibacteria group bacterium]|nr:MBL fold metallo-hydrolase [Candidatus Falkowbacteria bacterium]MBU3906565.1 MBL fold metallo-hydrolase [Patescibacteria group bacterium]MCG2698794.1 MBL fold metallo-hydrolase [Candidatus Parcubacteria bacterium]MBU4015780.1 MBL fold metallo-hydrolase [Patescibacteria group bacterium]MBU4026055.1 MBL fold metallo-hydrolase [Patescibacteria group bacterium]